MLNCTNVRYYNLQNKIQGLFVFLALKFKEESKRIKKNQEDQFVFLYTSLKHFFIIFVYKHIKFKL